MFVRRWGTDIPWISIFKKKPKENIFRPLHFKIWHGHHTWIRHSSNWSFQIESIAKKIPPGSNSFAACETDSQRTSWNYLNSSSGSLRNDRTARPRRPWAKLSRRGLRFVFYARIVLFFCFAFAFVRAVLLFLFMTCILRNMPRHFHEEVIEERLLWLSSRPSVLVEVPVNV